MIPQGTLGLQWPFRVASKWGEKSNPYILPQTSHQTQAYWGSAWGWWLWTGLCSSSKGNFWRGAQLKHPASSLSEYFSPLGGRQHPLWCDRTYLRHLHDSPQNSQLWYVGCLHLVGAKMIAFLLFYCFFKLWGYIYFLTAYPSEVGNIVHSSVVILLQLLYLRQN